MNFSSSHMTGRKDLDEQYDRHMENRRTEKKENIHTHKHSHTYTYTHAHTTYTEEEKKENNLIVVILLECSLTEVKKHRIYVHIREVTISGGTEKKRSL